MEHRSLNVSRNMKYLPAELLSPEQASRPATTSIIQAARLVKLSSVIDEFCFRFAFSRSYSCVGVSDWSRSPTKRRWGGIEQLARRRRCCLSKSFSSVKLALRSVKEVGDLAVLIV